MKRSTDALTDVRMVAEADAWMLTQGLQVQVCADFFLIQEHQVVPCGMVVGPNGSRGAAIGPGRAPKSRSWWTFASQIGGRFHPDLGKSGRQFHPSTIKTVTSSWCTFP